VNKSCSAFLSKHLIDRRGGHRQEVLRGRASRLAFDFLGSAERLDRQNIALADLLRHARDYVPCFLARMAGIGNISPGTARRVLSELPPMRRADIQQDIQRYLSERNDNAVDDATGGSTGTPMVFKVDWNTQVAREASLMWGNSMAGWRPGQKIAMLWGSDRDVKNAGGRWRIDLRWWIENMRWLNAFDMGEAQMASFHQQLSKFKPDFIVAYASSVFAFARFLRDRGMSPSYPAAGIISSAEMLTPTMRSTVEDVFGKPAFDRYGNREFAVMANQCEVRQALHVNEYDCILEIDSPDPFRKEGPIFVTYLRNLAMPFIRYDTGDVGRFEAGLCPCGRKTLRLAPVSGRQSDVIRTANGDLIHGEYFTHLLYGVRGVREFQFIQESLKSYRLLVVGDPERAATAEDIWRQRILEAIGPESELVIEFVPQIPALPSGKRKFTISQLEGS